MTYLVDVNVLIALIDPHHVAHAVAESWFEREGAQGWATCPIVENGAIRIVGGISYANPPVPCATVADVVSEWCGHPGHVFWADDLSIVDSPLVDRSRLVSPARITDAYLLTLAVHRGGKLATLDRRLSPAGVSGGAKALHVI